MKDVYIIGVDTLRFGKYLDKTHVQLAEETLNGVLADARLSIKDIQSVHFSNCLWGYDKNQQLIRGHIAMRHCKMDKIPITNHEAGCTSGSLAFYSAWKDILTGIFDCTMAIGIDKLHMEDKAKTMAAFLTGVDVANSEEHFRKWREVIKDTKVKIPEGLQPAQRSVFMDMYAYAALWHMDRYGTTQEQIAVIAAKNHHSGSLNPKAQYQFDMTVEQVLNDYMVSYPLTRSMCAPMGDGAAAAVLCSKEYFDQLPEDVQKRAVKIRASVYVSGRDYEANELSDDIRPLGASVEAAKLVYKMAGLGPKDIHVAEVHDATAFGELSQYENLGFCPVGEGGIFAASGATKLGGSLPVNPSGGLISRGHPIGASGLAMLHELVTQLRGQAGQRQVPNAKIALLENGGGNVGFDEAGCVVSILEAR